jgi:hypothetical protein
MRTLLFILACWCTLPAPGQVNRSATELAKENIQEYLKTRLFQDGRIVSLTFHELKTHTSSQKSAIAWLISMACFIEEQEFRGDSLRTVRRPYTFTFYLDRKMAVKRAESYISN